MTYIVAFDVSKNAAQQQDIDRQHISEGLRVARIGAPDIDAIETSPPCRVTGSLRQYIIKFDDPCSNTIALPVCAQHGNNVASLASAQRQHPHRFGGERIQHLGEARPDNTESSRQPTARIGVLLVPLSPVHRRTMPFANGFTVPCAARQRRPTWQRNRPWPVGDCKDPRAMGQDLSRRNARLVVITGLPGSGKTTLAVELAGSTGAVRMCPDDWMMASGIDLWDGDARARIEQLQLDLTLRLLAQGTNVIIEWGVWTRGERDALRDAAHAVGAVVELRYVTAPVEELWKRIVDRDLKGQWGSRSIARAELEEWWEIYEAPMDDELATYDQPV